MIQVLGLRDLPQQDGQARKREVFFQKNWRFQRVEDVFDPAKRAEVMAQIPESERFNLYFTVADCFEERGRVLKEQWAIPFDIDDIEITNEDAPHLDARRVAETACEALGVAFEETGVIFSGHGVQLFVILDKPILSDEFFETTRLNYGVLCQMVQRKLLERGLKGKVDPSVFSRGRLMRLPDTMNIKPGKTNRQAIALTEAATLRAFAFDVVELSGLQALQQPEQLSPEVLKNYPRPDTKAVCNGCKFLVYCRENQEKVSEPQWYASISVLARLENGPQLVHEYSEKHPKYSPYETDLKVEQALAASGPRTCKNIESLWDGCQTCDNYDKVTSPILVRGADYVASKDFGFRERRVDDKGIVHPGKPAYGDLVKEFGLQHPFKTVSENEVTYIFNGKHWEILNRIEIKAWADARIFPAATDTELNEFVARLKVKNVVRMSWFDVSRQRMMNFQNCVLDLKTMEVHNHNPIFGFFNVLPFPYDPRATAPRWEKFLMEIMSEREDMAELLKEYGGYAISGDSCWAQKALLMVGEGSNGKSVYMKILGEVAGRDAFAAVPLQALGNPASRQITYNKLFNYSEETSAEALSRSEVFKVMADGGEIEYKVLYQQPFMAPNRAKLILSANNMPYTTDRSNATYRRLLIVRFNKEFKETDENFDRNLIEKLRTELPGICNSLIAAYNRLYKNEVFSGGATTRAELELYRQESDNVIRFLQDQVDYITDETKGETTVEVYTAYRMYCEIQGEKPLSSVGFGRQLGRVMPDYHKRVRAHQENGKFVRRIYGIKLHKEF